jgi:hypothetical protein
LEQAAAVVVAAVTPVITVDLAAAVVQHPLFLEEIMD